MSTMTLEDRELLVIVEDGASEEEWHDGRADGVTASEVHDIAHGSRKAWRTILDGKLNGTKFRGNAHTQRGHDREAPMVTEAAKLDGVVALARSGALFGNPDNPAHRGTPDGFGIHAQLGDFGLEMKSHDEGWEQSKIPAEHVDQMQWGMHITGLGWWLYVWEVIGVDGIFHEWVPRDDRRIAQLVRQADAFIEWRAAGAPEIDDIPDEVDDALADYARGLALASEGDALKKAARPVIDVFAATQKAKHGDPLRRGGSRAALFFEPKPSIEVLDETAWAAAEPEIYEEWLALQQRVLDTASAAAVLYHQTKTVAPTFRVTPNTEAKK